MDTNDKASKSKSSETENKKASEVVVVISDDHLKVRESVDSPQNESSPSLEISTKAVSRKPSLARSVFSKPKSRFGEPPFDMFAKNGTLKTIDEVADEKLRTRGGAEEEDENEKICEKVNTNEWVMVQCVLLLCILGFMAASLTVDKLQRVTILGLEIWKWCVLVMVALFGLLITNLFMEVVSLMVRRRLFFTKTVFNFVHSLRSSFQVFVWLSLVLTTWILLFDCGAVNTSPTASRYLNYITRTLIIFPIGAFLWLSKTMLLKIFTSSLHATTRFDRIQESIFHQYILQKLSGLGNNTSSQLRFQRITKKRGKEKKGKLEFMDMNGFYKIKGEEVSAGTMILFVDIILGSRMSISIPNVPKQSGDDDGERKHIDKEITKETEAIRAAYHIFQNIAKRGCNYIDEKDLERFLTLKEMDQVFPLSKATEMEPILLAKATKMEQIDREALIDWVVKVFKDRQALVHALDDTKTAIRQLGKLASGILIISMVIVWLLLVGIATIKVLFLLASQLLVVALIFGNSFKTTFEAIIFIFIMHPFDVGDRCVIDDVQMIVEELNILTTVFLRFDNAKIYYPNSVLATKPIINFDRSPDMRDSLEFSIDFTTPLQKIGDLKEKIKKYLEGNSQFWYPNHSVVVVDIENVNKLKMALNFTHTMNFQNYGETCKRKSKLVLEMKKIFEDLGIKYSVLQEVHLVN